MVVWSGFGILVLVIPVLTVLAIQSVTDALFGAAAYRQNAQWLPSLGLLLSALAIWLLGRRLNSRGARRLLDPATGEEVILRPRHAFFFIRMECWAALLLLVAAWLAVARPS